MARVTHAAAHLSLEEVKSRLKNDHRPWCRQRWLIIYNALIDPRPAKEIAKHCGASKATVHQLISNYNRLGVEVVETPGKGGRRHEYLTLAEEDGFLAPFFARAERGEIATAAEIQRAFEARIGQEVDDSTIYRLLHRHGWRKLMPRPRHPQATTEAQEQFKRNFAAQVEAAVATRPPEDERPVLIMAQDEGRFGRICHPKRCWAPPGIRPRSPRQIVREYTYVYAAVAPAEGKMTSLILPMADTAMMNLFLEHVGKTFMDYFIVMQVDQAGWHQAKALKVPENIRLIPQPPYSPEVNPVEHLWEELREKYFHNLIFSSLDLLSDELCRGLNELTADKARLTSMMSFAHLNVCV